MSASEVQICNLALLKFGEKSVTSIVNPSTKEERACSVFYPLLRDEMLAAHPWNFAMRRADISAPLAATPVFGYSYAYTLPPDCLRAWELANSDADWEVEGRQLLTDQESEIYLRYIAQVTETGYFVPAFVNCLALRLGAELAAKLADDKSMRAALLEELERVALPQALRLNAIEGKKPRNKGIKPLDESSYSWQTAGR